MTLSLNTLTPDTPLFAEMMELRGQPLPEFDPWDPTYVPTFEGLQKPMNDLQQALGSFDSGGIALGETAMDIAAEIEAFHLHALQELELRLPEAFLDPHAPRTALEWFAHARTTLAKATAVIDPAELQAAVVISDVDSSSMIIVAQPPTVTPAPIEVQSERIDETPTARLMVPSAVIENTAFRTYADMLIDATSPPPALDYGAREALGGLITAEAIRGGVAKISASVVDSGTPERKPTPAPRKRGHRRRSHDVTEECTGTGLCKTGCIVRPPAEESQMVELPPIAPGTMPELSDAEMDELLNVPIRFWVCPVVEHHDPRDDQGGMLASVEWRDEVAYCLAPECGRTSADVMEESDTA